jgi:lipopolysaccharide assembly outer membrane protein LptD (OstA)
MRKRILIVAAGALLCAGGLALAQDTPFTFLQADSVDVTTRFDSAGRTAPEVRQSTLTGNVVFEVNGVLVRADRAVIKDREVSLEGNVRLTLPQPK